MELSIHVQRSLLRYANIEILQHSGKIADLPRNVKHFGTEMLDAGWYAIFHNQKKIEATKFLGNESEENSITQAFIVLVRLIENENKGDSNTNIPITFDPTV